MKFISCPVCGHKNRATMKFCRVCLSRIQDVEPKIFKGIEQPEIKKGRNLNRWAFIFIVVIMLYLFIQYRIIHIPLFK